MSENKGYQIWLPILLALFTVAGMLIGYNLQPQQTIVNIEGESDDLPTATSSYGAGRIEEILRYVESKYVDEVNRDELMERAIDKLLHELDPHSNYITAKELRSVNESLEGNFVGIGIEFDIHNDTILVLSVIEDGPSDELGILPGDRIVEVEDSIVAGIGVTTDDVTDKLRGEEGTEVRIGVRRGNNNKIIQYTIERGMIPLKSVDAAVMLDNKTGYIKVNRFSDTTYEEFMDGLDDLMDENMEDLVIDLRQNPGGYLKEATRILNQLIEKRNEMLVYTEGIHSSKKEYKTKGAVKHKIDDIAVLIDEGSASASEIMAGAIQDVDRGLVMGRRSFGKGLVQEQYDLSDGSALRLTVARYYTKSGRLIQKSYGEGTNYDNDANDRFENGEFDNKDNISVSDSTAYYTDNGRVVYSGTGIIPDVFVPMDDAYRNDNYIAASSHMVDFIYGLLDDKRSLFTEMDAERFINDYEVDDSTFESFMAFCMVHDDDLKREELLKIAPLLKNRIKSNIARNVYGLDAYYKVRNQSDVLILKTLDILDESENLLDKD